VVVVKPVSVPVPSALNTNSEENLAKEAYDRQVRDFAAAPASAPTPIPAPKPIAVVVKSISAFTPPAQVPPVPPILSSPPPAQNAQQPESSAATSSTSGEDEAEENTQPGQLPAVSPSAPPGAGYRLPSAPAISAAAAPASSMSITQVQVLAGYRQQAVNPQQPVVPVPLASSSGPATKKPIFVAK